MAVVVAILFALPAISISASRSGGTNDFAFVDLPPSPALSESLARRLSVLPSGLHTFGGILFRAQGFLAVTGMDAARAGEFFPSEVTGIQIGQRVRRLHLLHGTMFADKDGAPVTKIVFHYAEGGQESVRLGYGVHVRAWLAPRMEKRVELFDPNSRLAWAEVDERRNTAFRLFQTAIENPRPREIITRVDVVSLFSRAAPFIVATTIEGEHSTLPANRPQPSRKVIRDLREFSDSVYRGEVLVRVRDGVLGASATNAAVSLSITDDKETYFFGESGVDADGMARLPYPPLHTVGLNLWAHAPDRAPAILTDSRTNRATLALDYAITLNPGLTVGGRVMDAGSNAIAGAQVAIHKVSRRTPLQYQRIDYDVAMTGPDGRWTSRSIPDDRNGLNFRVTHPDFRPAHFVTTGSEATSSLSDPAVSSASSRIVESRQMDVAMDSMSAVRRARASRPQPVITLSTNALAAGGAVMTLQPAMLLKGRIVEAGGKPISGAEVILQRAFGERKYVRTGTDGRFESRVGEPGEAIGVVVVREGFAPFHRNVVLSAKGESQDFQIRPPNVVNGRVQDRNARPVSGARVRLEDWNGMSDLVRFQAVTDTQGNFTWTSAPPDQITLGVSKTNYYNTRHSFAGSMSNITITINRAPGVFGKVYDADTKQPIPTFTVIPGRKYSRDDRQIRWDRSETLRGREGEYALKLDSYFFQPEARVLVEAVGYQPQVSRGFNQPDFYTNDFALKKGQGITGTVRLPDGSPAPGVTLVLVERGEFAYLESGGQLRGASGSTADLVRSDGKGQFEFAPRLEPDLVFASHAQGFAAVKVSVLQQERRIVLEPWGNLKGSLRVGDATESEAFVRLHNNVDQMVGSEGLPARLYYSVKADAGPDGSFSFTKVPPGEHRLALEYRFKDDRDGNPAFSHSIPVVMRPAESKEIVLGGSGRRVTGRVVLSGGDHANVDWRRDIHRLNLLLPDEDPDNANPAHFRPPMLRQTPGDRRGPMTPEALRARQRAERSYVLLFDTNGNFRVENVPPGRYTLTIQVTDPEDEYYNRRAMGSVTREVIVPDERQTKVNAPFDIGAIPLTIRPRIKIGRVVPSFEGKTGEGRTIKLSDYRGKHVLLFFWGMSVGYSTYDFQTVQQFQGKFSADKLAILGCNLDADAKSAAQFATRQNMNWPQIYLGDSSQTSIPGMFGIHSSSGAVLIDPEGRLSLGQMRGTAMRHAVEGVLSGESE